MIKLTRWLFAATFLLLFCSACGNNAQATTPTASTATSAVATTNSQIVATPVTTTGCGKTAPATPSTTLDATLTSDGAQRTYKLHVPTGYDTQHAAPLVLDIPGMNETAQEQEIYSRYDALADQQHFLLVYPQGTIDSGGKLGWSTYGRFDPKVNDVLFFSDLLNALQKQLCIDATRIYATGISNGGGMTNLLACQMAGRIAAVAEVSAAIYTIPGGCHPTRPVPYLEFHGTSDPLVHYNGGKVVGFAPIMQTMQSWATLNGCTSGPTTFFQQADVTGFQWSGCKNGAIVQHYRISGGGHTWPGARAVPHLGPTTQTISATTLGWQFFQHYHL